MTHLKTIIITVTIIFINSITLLAQDRHFAWNYNSPTLTKGSVDVEVWNTYSFGRKNYHYSQFWNRLEFEFGVTNKIQTSFYINSKHRTIGPVESDTLNPSLGKTSSFSFSNAWKFYLLNRSIHAIGLSAYIEYYLGQGEIELEAKVMIDKIIDKHWLVLNVTFEEEFEWEPEVETENGKSKVKIELEKETKLINEFGYMFHPKPSYGFGIEARNQSVFKEGKIEYSSLFIGPSVFFSQGKFFFTLNFMPQIVNLAGENKPLELNDQEKYMYRAFIGMSL